MACNIGIAFQAHCKAERWAICRVFVPKDDVDAQCRMIPRTGVKLSAAGDPKPAIEINNRVQWRILKWLVRKVGHVGIEDSTVIVFASCPTCRSGKASELSCRVFPVGWPFTKPKFRANVAARSSGNVGIRFKTLARVRFGFGDSLLQHKLTGRHCKSWRVGRTITNARGVAAIASSPTPPQNLVSDGISVL